MRGETESRFVDHKIVLYASLVVSKINALEENRHGRKVLSMCQMYLRKLLEENFEKF